MDALAQFIPIILISIPFAIGNFYLAKRFSKNTILWVILSLIPAVNFWFFWYVAYLVLFKVLDSLDALHSKQ